MLTVSRFGSTTQNSCAPLERQRTAFSRISELVFEGDNASLTRSGEPCKLSSSPVASHLCCETYATSAPQIVLGKRPEFLLIRGAPKFPRFPPSPPF